MKANAKREQLVDDVARKLGVTRKTAATAVDEVLDEVIAMARPRLENEWSGGVVLHQLYQWRGLR